jgi:ADP-heptose:LPS heptosyltransferase
VERASNLGLVVLFPGALGDLVLAMPALAGLGRRHVGARLTLVVSGWLRALAATAGVAHVVASLDDADAAGLFGGSRLPSWLDGRPTVYSWIGSRDAEVRARIEARADRASFFAVERSDGSEHAAIVYARQVGLAEAVQPFRWPAPPATPAVEALLHGARRPLLGLHQGAGSPAKRWAADGFHDIARRWHAAGGDVIEIIGPADHGLPPTPGARRAADRSLVDVAALLARVDAYVGNDSGPSHLAGAIGTRGVAVFGPTPARRWAPHGDAIVTLEAAGDLRAGIPTAAMPPERVWSALERRADLDKVEGRA